MRQVRLRHRSGSHMGTKSLPGQRHPGGVPWVHSAFGAGGPRFETQAGNPISGPLPFRGDSLETKKGAWELGLMNTFVMSIKHIKKNNPIFVLRIVTNP